MIKRDLNFITTHIWFFILFISDWKSEYVGLYVLLLVFSFWYKGRGIVLLKSTNFKDLDLVIWRFSKWIVLLVEPVNLDELEGVVFKFWKLISIEPSSCSITLDIWSDSSIGLGDNIS